MNEQTAAPNPDKHATYIGKRLRLFKKTALVHRNPAKPGVWMAQFDDYATGPYSHGWHEFGENEFQLDEPESGDAATTA